jgi:nitroimidazol reductase NimA-like FMN-containing flavoprotein (pyridoxamine 5'-phosphate oxidase superfamily)
LVELSPHDALRLAESHSVGRMFHVSEDRLFVEPVNFRLIGRSVFVRTTAGSRLLNAARRAAPAAFEIDDLVNWSRSGWSVLIRGTLRELAEAELPAAAAPCPWPGSADRDTHLVCLDGREITGRLIEPGAGGVVEIHL